MTPLLVPWSAAPTGCMGVLEGEVAWLNIVLSWRGNKVSRDMDQVGTCATTVENLWTSPEVNRLHPLGNAAEAAMLMSAPMVMVIEQPKTT